jgi:hypothetical protein
VNKETARAPKTAEPLESQVERLARFIMECVPGEPSRPEGATDTAIRLLIHWGQQLGKVWAVPDWMVKRLSRSEP